MRKQPDVNPPQAITPKQLEGVVTQVREYQLITPLYGGGVTPNEADPVTVVRATEVRGHLRFWWRATRGGKFGGDVKKMWEEENRIWGKAYKKGDPEVRQEDKITITIDIDCSQRGNPVKPFVIERRRPKSANHIPCYAAFPLQPDQEKLQESNPHVPDVWSNVSFTLTISFPEMNRKEVEAALWAWETFGGLGARTRRGFGALRLLKVNHQSYQILPDSRDVEQWLRKNLDFYVEPEMFQYGVPHLNKEMQLVVTTPSPDPVSVWNQLITALSGFRQHKDARRQSVWPEAKAIRSLIGQTRGTYPQKFPRAAFGLPIIFHFTGAKAPADMTLMEREMEQKIVLEKEQEKQKHFASPLILRPFLCSDNRAVGLALVLEGSHVDLENLVIEEKGKRRSHPVQGTLTRPEARSISVLRGETDVLRAFMNYLRGVSR